jgi:hypothetical protein
LYIIGKNGKLQEIVSGAECVLLIGWRLSQTKPLSDVALLFYQDESKLKFFQDILAGTLNLCKSVCCVESP